MNQSVNVRPDANQLFYASLIATALVYLAGALIFSSLTTLGTQTGGWMAAVGALGFFATIGLIGAAAAAFLLIAPMGTAYGLLVLRISPSGWWQGPVTGALVAITLEALVIFVISRDALQWELGNAVMLAIPIVLAIAAGGFVQKRVLNWPDSRTSRAV